MIKNTEEARLRRIFDERKDIAKLIKKMNDLYYKGDFVKSLEIRRRIEEMWDKEKSVVLEVKRSVMDTVGDLPKEEQLEMLTMLHSIFFMSDIFVGILGDFKDAIKRVEPNSRMERFDGIEKLVKECEAEVSYLLKGCSLNFATQKPLNAPIRAPRPTASMITTKTGRGWRPGHILLATSAACNREAATQAVIPTVRPAERSVPVRTIHPPIPNATGKYAAVWESRLIIELGEIKLGSVIAM